MKKPHFFDRRLFLLGISLWLYMMGLIFPALAFEIVNYKTVHSGIIIDMKGIEVTAWGVLGLLFLQIPAIGWLANPLYWLSCVFFCKEEISVLYSFYYYRNYYWFSRNNIRILVCFAKWQ